MKNIDFKSFAIGVLLTSTVFFGVAATNITDTWNPKQKWEWKKLLVNKGKIYGTWQVVDGGWIHEANLKSEDMVSGWEPIAPAETSWKTFRGGRPFNMVWARKRVQ